MIKNFPFTYLDPSHIGRRATMPVLQVELINPSTEASQRCTSLIDTGATMILKDGLESLNLKTW